MNATITVRTSARGIVQEQEQDTALPVVVKLTVRAGKHVQWMKLHIDAEGNIKIDGSGRK